MLLQWRHKGVCLLPPHPAIRSPTDILMVTTTALVWTLNSMLSWGCNYIMQWNLGWSVATVKKKTAAHTFCICLCWNKVMYITLFSINWFFLLNTPHNQGQISEFHIFAPPNAAPCTKPPGAYAPFPPPLCCWLIRRYANNWRKAKLLQHCKWKLTTDRQQPQYHSSLSSSVKQVVYLSGSVHWNYCLPFIHFV